MRVFISIVALLVGAALLLFAYVWASPPKFEHPLLSFIASNLGGLLIFTTAYTYISEHHLETRFEQRMKATIREELNVAHLHQSITSNGLTEVFDRYSDELTFKAMQSAAQVRIVIMRGNAFFRDYHRDIRERILNGMTLEIIFPNPKNSDLMKILSQRYSDLNVQTLAASIATTLNTWIIEKIHKELPEQKKSALRVYLVDTYPLYSAYLFDQKTLWYIPYHYRKDRQKIPVFVYSGQLNNLEIYKDVMSLSGGNTSHDLSSPLNV
ncbi:MAG TPA: hypothetical protein VIB39_19055 [Candidatus Angelobacter sp.]|jgi:ABC-type multidrug transport system fused ATPase/permease subunit